MRKTAALYDPYLDTLGGGEKYILSILKVLSEEDFEINIFWDKDLTSEIKNRLSLQFNIKLEFLPNIFRKSSPLSFVNKLTALKKFDYFFYMTDGSYFFSSAKKNFVYVMIPQKELVNMNIINRLKTNNYIFITHSKFTQNWLKKWGIKSELIYPYIDIGKPSFVRDFVGTTAGKQKIILSVGRFFKHLHSKRQDLVINFFQLLKKQPAFKDFKLVLAGGLKKEDEEYFNEIKKSAGDNPSIVFKPNITFNELDKLYELSTYYWHLTGYGVDEDKQPELVEHLGITPLEAMASGCITFCYQAGGPKEIINDGVNGFLFKTGDELIQKMLKAINNINLQNKIRSSAVQFVKDNFSYQSFKDKVTKIILY